MKISGLTPTTIAWILLGVTALALALPLFGTLAEGPTFFVAHAASRLDIVLFALATYLLLPAALLLLIFVARNLLGEKASLILLSGVVAIFAAIWSLSFFKTLPAGAAFSASSAVAVVAAWAFYSDKIIRPLLVLVGQISLIIPLYFLFLTPVNALLSSERVAVDLASSASNSDMPNPVEASTPVVMLVLDELPLAALLSSAEDIDAVRFPNFARLQAMSTWYRNTTTASTHTHLAISAILSGERPRLETFPIPSQLPQNLFSLLGSSHEIHAIESVSRLCTPDLCESRGEELADVFNAIEMYADARFIWLHSVLPREIAAQYLPTLGGKWRGFDSGEMSASTTSGSGLTAAIANGFDSKHKIQWQRFVANMALDGPVLNYLHIGLPHHPWIYLPDGTVYNGRQTPAATYTHDWKKRPQLVKQALLRFAMQVEYVDTLLGEALDALERSSQFDQTLLVVISDHGLAIAPGEKRRTPFTDTIADVAVIPMFIKYPGQTVAKIDDRPVETIDILPTIAHTLQIPLRKVLDGQPLNSDTWATPTRKVFEADKSAAGLERSIDLSKALARFHSVVPPGKSALHSWKLGSGGDYLGQSPALEGPANSALVFELDRPEWYERVDASSGFLPARLTGSIGGAPRRSHVLIALNDVIAGGSVTHDKHGSISVMLQPSAFRTGYNELSAYLVSGGALQEIAIGRSEKVKWDLQRTDGVFTTITRESGESYVLDQSKSGVAAISRNAPLAAIVGKAFNEQDKTTPIHLLLVSGSRVITTKFRAFYGRTVKEAMATVLVSAFSVEVVPEQIPEGSELHVLALWQDGTFLPISVTDNTDLFE